jgi:hypothetical protein
MDCTVGGGQATLTIPGTNIQIPLGPTQPAQQQTTTVNTQGQQGNVTSQQTQQSGQTTTTNQAQTTNQQTQNQTNNTQSVQQGNQQQTQQPQQQNTVITIPGTNNTIQIPANFGGRCMVFGFTLKSSTFIKMEKGFPLISTETLGNLAGKVHFD